MDKLRIVIAEDHEIVREGLKALVNAQPDMRVIGEANHGYEAIQAVKNLQPDIIIMDVTMPKLNGLEATKKLKQICPQVKILTLTRHAEAGFIQQLLRAGAEGYVLKQSASAELIRAIRALGAGNNYLDPAITGKVMTGYAGKEVKISVDPKNAISDREEEIIRLVAWGYSNKEIANRLEISVKTVETHKTNIMKKLNFRGRIDMVRYALLRGWLKDN
ncbi:MAG: response regulator transcription factor [Acidobacteriota bacterium]